MTYTVDTTAGTIVARVDGRESRVPLYSKEGFELLSELWLKVGWNQKYTYTFSWLGRPIIQLPDDMIRIQEVIHAVRPDVIVETGVAHGGSLIYYASLCTAMGHGRVIGVDIEIRPHNRAAIEAHPAGAPGHADRGRFDRPRDRGTRACRRRHRRAGARAARLESLAGPRA